MPEDINRLIDQIADRAETGIDEILAHPPQNFDAATWLAFVERLRAERADLQLARSARAEP